MEAAAMPLPSPETTPPVTKMYLVLMRGLLVEMKLRMQNAECRMKKTILNSAFCIPAFCI